MRISLMVATGCLLLTAGVAHSAHASCHTRDGRVSPDVFIGTVIGTKKNDRIATVITDTGRTVTVLGTGDAAWFTESFSSVDRRFALGGRYEFHPLNAESPYQDNRCTATHQLAGPKLQPLEHKRQFLPGWLLVDEQVGLIGYLIFFGPIAVVMALLLVMGRKVVSLRLTALTRTPR